MWSAVLVGAVVVIISGSSMVYAQQREGEGERGKNAGFSAEERTPAHRCAQRSRSAPTLLRERLRLTPEQAKSCRRSARPRTSAIPRFNFCLPVAHDRSDWNS